MKACHDMPFGARPRPGGGATFRLWAPAARSVELVLHPPAAGGAGPGGTPVALAMAADGAGWHQLDVAQARPGDRYRFRIHGRSAMAGEAALEVADPAGRANPDGPLGPSVLVDPLAFDWGPAEAAWQGLPLHEAVFYELHVGTFTPEGTYAAAAQRLPYLRELGITAVELMPLAEYGGARGWGYDGVLPFAPKAVHGTPEDLKAFVRAAHALGLMVFLDVVYNHFGPVGNDLAHYAPQFFTGRHRTPWGPAIALEGDPARPVRDFFLHNALYWLMEFRFDGLRLDAVDALVDGSPLHLVAELAATVRARVAAHTPGRHVHVVMENARNPASWLDPERGAQRIDAQWNDDFHHAMHVLLTGEGEGYYAGFARHERLAPLDLVARTLAEGYAYQGETYPPWQGPRGEPSAHLPPTCFVHFLQNHDHIGNRAHGERLSVLAAPHALRAATAVLLLAPHPPLLFMGEEFGATTPFLYFCDHAGALGDAVREGRRAEFAPFAPFRDAALRERIPDPCATSTFDASRLRWDDLDDPAHQAVLAYTRALLQQRRAVVVPRVPRIVPGAATWRRLGPHGIEVRWPLQPGDDGVAALVLRANLGAAPWPAPGEPAAAPDDLAARGECLFRLHGQRGDMAGVGAAAAFDAGTAGALAAWDVHLWLERAPAVAPLDTAVVPRATYRVQLHAGFGFEAARALLPHLQALGISHLYLSPVMRARAGSTHGYDIVDHDAVNPELGSEADFVALCRAAQARGLHVLLDIVPNHMGVLEADNAWWLDVLRHGPASRHAGCFDIDWAVPDPLLHGRVLIPVLGDTYGCVLEAGELRLVFDAARTDFDVRYHGHRFPVDPATWPDILPPHTLPADLGAADEAELRLVLADLAQLPPRTAAAPRPGAPDRTTLADAVRARLAALLVRAGVLQSWVDERVAQLNGQPGQPRSVDALDALIARQAWRPAHWRVAGDDINYRRFFNVNELAGLRMESPAVFEATHRRLLGWLRDGLVAGVRIDHPDGLLDPGGYLQRLQQRHAEERSRTAGVVPRALYVLVEKILAEHEHLPTQWPVHGTTGYEFGAAATAVLVDARGQARIERIWRAFTGATAPFDTVVVEAKHLILQRTLAAELSLVTEALLRIARGSRLTRDHTRNGLRSALAELVAGFPVYRTYLDGGPMRDEDRQVIAWALANARRRCRPEDLATLDFIAGVLRDEQIDHAPDAALRRRFIGRFQQLTAPAMAKSVEDTAFYRHTPLLALNEVGADPSRPGGSVAAFHAANRQRAAATPAGLLGTSTHDTKRSEDVRARLAVLSEQPALWRLALQRWQRLNRRRKLPVEGASAPSAHDEYLLYQTLVGLWPATPVTDDATLADLRQRVQGAMQKSVREAQWHSSWTSPDAAYEGAVAQFIDALLGQREPNPFLHELETLVQALAPFGHCNSLAMTLLKLTSPGVPDIYQGCEDWAHTLVDPDNRRPVDAAAIARRLAGLPADAAVPGAWLSDQWARPDGGALKLHVVQRLLRWRAAHAVLFRRGDYLPLRVTGPGARHVVAFARLDPDALLVTLAPRCLATWCGGEPARLRDAGAWQGTRVEWPAPLRRWGAKAGGPVFTELLGGARMATPDETSLALEALWAQQPLAAWAATRAGAGGVV